jgi:hypothetical protein
MTHALDPIRTAVVHPIAAPSLLGAVEAARINLITPVLVGLEAKLCAAALAPLRDSHLINGGFMSLCYESAILGFGFVFFENRIVRIKV